MIDYSDLNEYRLWIKHCNALASALGEWRKRELAINTLESKAKVEGLDEFVYWYWGTARDAAYKGESE